MVLPGHKGPQIHTVQVLLLCDRAPGRGHKGGQKIQGPHWLVIHGTALQHAGPRHDERHANAALQQDALLAVQRGIDRTIRIHGPAVVTDEHDQGPLRHVRCFHRAQNGPDVDIQTMHHGTVRTPLLLLHASIQRQVLFQRLHGRVRRIKGNIQKKRLFCVALHKVNRFIADIVRDVGDGLGLFVAALNGRLIPPAIGR